MSSSNVQKENAQPEVTTPRGGSKMRSLANSAKKTKDKLLSFVQSTPEQVSLPFSKTLPLFSKTLQPLTMKSGYIRLCLLRHGLAHGRLARFLWPVFFASVPSFQTAGDGEASFACHCSLDSVFQVWHPVSRPSNVQRQCFLNMDLEWNGNAFAIGQQIGSGSFATVFLGTHNGTGQTFAIKKVPLPAGQHFKRQKESLEREIMVLRECRSPYIVSYFGSFVDPENVNMCIVMEFLAGGTLQDVVREYDQHGGLDEPSMHFVLVSVLRGLAYLHERNIMHRDLVRFVHFLVAFLLTSFSRRRARIF
jgi:hypothetical protein